MVKIIEVKIIEEGDRVYYRMGDQTLEHAKSWNLVLPEEWQLRAWCRALRSGHYKPMPGQLKRETADGVRYCCLGVLGETLGLEFKKFPARPSYKVWHEAQSSWISYNLEGKDLDDRLQKNLSSFNDHFLGHPGLGHDFTDQDIFDAIATYIEYVTGIGSDRADAFVDAALAEVTEELVGV